jgi:hypothetical protein
MMKYIELTQGKSAIVDDADYERLSCWKWFAHSGGYAVRNAPMVAGVRYGILYMHRLIVDAPTSTEVDHINGNKLDNRRSNLRICDPSLNQANRKIRQNTTSQFKGVRYRADRKKWEARIKVKGRGMFLGYFGAETQAARAYDTAAVLHFGEFARTNFQEGQQ